MKLDGLAMTYSGWEKDANAVVEWHIHHAESRENDVLFHEIIDGMLEMEAPYLEWKHERSFSKPVRAKGNYHNSYTNNSRDPSRTE